MYDSVMICGSPDLERRVEAYASILGRDRVQISDTPGDVNGQNVIIDIRGQAEDKRRINDWQERGALVISDALPAPTVEASRELMTTGRVLVGQWSRYDPRFQLIQQQLENGDIGPLVAVRWVSLWPEDCWLPEGVVENYAYSALDALGTLMGTPKRIMARQLSLKRDVPDTLFAVIVAEETDAIGYLEISCCQPSGSTAEQIEVVGRSGILEYDSKVNRTLRHTGPHGSDLRDAFWEPPLAKMLRHYMTLPEQEEQLSLTMQQMQDALALVERTLESCQTNLPA